MIFYKDYLKVLDSYTYETYDRIVDEGKTQVLGVWFKFGSYKREIGIKE